MSSKPSLPRGTRDFAPEVMLRRNYLFSFIRATFEKYGFLPLETPAMEQLSVLTGKYGDEGDQLIFKILNSGNYLEGQEDLAATGDSKKLAPLISEKALRYDLTVPFARFVSMNRGQLTFPFKRYQIQPVWRADRPQKGRYREFYQCDADVVGTDSLLCEAEIVRMIKEVLGHLGILNYVIKLNNRKVLSGIAQAIGAPDKMEQMCMALDKLDKTDWAGVAKELNERGFEEAQTSVLKQLFERGNGLANLDELIRWFDSLQVETGKQGIMELKEVIKLIQFLGDDLSNIEIDFTLARGLSYYTGAILEVKPLGIQMGSISGGGRYDNLTGVFGVPGLSGVGFSFGVDRIYDVMEELNLFPPHINRAAQVLVANFDPQLLEQTLGLAADLRNKGISTEIYPEEAKMKKQFSYADSRGIRFVVILGSDEWANQEVKIKDMITGQQVSVQISDLVIWPGFTN